MTPPLSIALLALSIGLLAAWFATPTPPPLQGEAWFKTTLARRLFREPEAAWRDAIRRFVPFHPAGRLVEQKLSRPESAVLAGGPSDVERGLLAELAALPDVASRWRRITEDSDRALLDPATPLSADHAPKRWLGPSFEARSPTEVAVEAELRLHARWVLVPGTPRAAVPDVEAALRTFAVQVDVEPGELEATVTALAERLRALAPERSSRLIVATTGDAAPMLLRALAEHVDVRDRVVAVVAIGAVIHGLPDVDGPLGEAVMRDWLEHHFRHEHLDVELVRLVPYVSLAWLAPGVDPPGLAGLPVRAQRFPEPGFVGREPPFVEPVDLGVLPADPSLPVDAVADSLRLVVDLWTLSRR